MGARLPPCVVRPNFLGESFSARLLALAIETEAGFRPSRIVVGEGKKAIDPSFRMSQVQAELGPLEHDVRDVLQAAAPELIESLRVTPFDVAEIEIEMAAHGDGAFYKRHVDTFSRDTDVTSDRLVSGVYYFHRTPKQYSGGALRIYAFGPGSDRYLDVEPEHDTLIVFPSWAAHEVLPVFCPSGRFADSRFALNCWFLRARVS
jgi:SM-20-related protein